MQIADINSEETEKVEIFISCRSLKEKEGSGKADPQVLLYYKSENGSWVQTQKSEVIQNNTNPNFVKTFTMDYHFEKQQHLKFEIVDDDGGSKKQHLIGSVITSLGAIVGSKQQTLVLSIQDSRDQRSGKIILRAEKSKSSMEYLYIKWSGHKIKDTRFFFFEKTNPFLRFFKISEMTAPLLIYQTEVAKKNLSPQFKEFQVNLGKLCDDDKNRPVLVELWDHYDSGKHEYMGEFKFTVNELIGQKMKEFSAKHKKSQSEVGSFYPELAKIDIRPSFLDYIRGGTQLALIGAIDYTSSNGDPSSPRSLHSIQPGKLNQYQQALKAVGEILLHYDHDKKVPMFGFGAKPQMPNLVSPTVLHCFPLNGMPENPEVENLQGMLDVYRYSLDKVILSGPTKFSPLIHETMKIAQMAKDIQRQNPDEDQYFLLLIITDGEIHDMPETKAAIVDSWDLPYSIIIIGVGTENFEKMEVIDGDDGLWDDKGRKAKRDLVQFVPFNEYKENPQILAEKVLEELPTQMEEYMQAVGRKPLAPKQHMNHMQSLGTMNFDVNDDHTFIQSVRQSANQNNSYNYPKQQLNNNIQQGQQYNF